MAIVVNIAAKTAAVAIADATTEFTTIKPFCFYGDNFGIDEHAILYRVGPSGTLKPLTNKDGVVKVSAFPNVVFVEAFGVFRTTKSLTAAQASTGYQEQP